MSGKTKKLSNEFYNYLNQTRINWLKIVAIFGFILIPGFIILDFIIVPQEVFLFFVKFRVAVSFGLILQYFILRFWPKGAAIHGVIISLAVGIMISQMTKELGGFNSPYYAGLNLVMMAVVILIPWGFWLGVLNSMIIIGSYLIVNLINLKPFDINILINNVYFLFSTGFIAVSASQIRMLLLKKEYYANINLTIAKKEQDTIMNAVQDGLFIIYVDEGICLVGSQQSQEVKKIFGEVDFAGKKFTDLMKGYFPEEKAEELNEYLKMIFTRDVEEDMIRDLNPLEQEVTESGNPEISGKTLRFEFIKIEQESGEKNFLVRVKDISQQIEMENLIKMNQLRSENESQMMLAILQQGPAMLNDFIQGVETEILAIEEALGKEVNAENKKDTVEIVFRAAHSMKGNAALLDLKFFAEELDNYEEKILVLRKNPEFNPADLPPLKNDLVDINKTYQRIKELIQQIQQFQNQAGGVKANALEALPKAIEDLVKRAADDTGKKVKVITENINFDGVDETHAYLLRDVLVQLTRNSISHGLEKPDVRKAAGKPEEGIITYSMEPVQGKYIINYKDDGSSFNFEAIRKRGLEKGLIAESELDKWDEKKLIKLIFDSGFSTAEESDMHAGRGVGMDIIKERIKKMGGDIKVNYRKGQFTLFQIIFPVEVLKSGGNN